MKSRLDVVLKQVWAVGAAWGLVCGAYAQAAAPKTLEIVAKVPVSQVWAGHTVGFSFKAHKGRLYAAYYDADRRMTVASCAETNTTAWTYRILPSNVGWDSHNYITFAFDAEDNIHLAGNMHAQPLIYFRTARPLDLASFARVPAMVGPREKRCTYPQFLFGPKHRLVFHYRDGCSGNGDEIYDVYDESTKAWSRLLDRPLTDGKGLMNAYFVGPQLGPDGFFHLAGVWRDNPRCETNHDLSYMRSRDLRHWETAAGVPLALPVTVETPGLVVDATPPANSGLINMGTKIGFDAENRVVLTYHKYDAQGFSQIYNARFEGNAWKIRPATDWKTRWSFSGPGSVACEVSGGAVFKGDGNVLAQSYHPLHGGSYACVLDPVALKPAGPYKAPPQPTLPDGVRLVEGTFPGLHRHVLSTKGTVPNVGYYLTWDSLGANRDRPRPQPWPGPSNLTLWVLKNSGTSR